MIGDAQSGITNITWAVYNKPALVEKPTGNISYNYNTANQRISKTYNGLTTWYIRDAQGNMLAVYDNTHGNINWREQHLYGSSRIGMWRPNINLADSNALDKWDTTGYRQFELDNHLGNVMTTISDVRVPYFKPSHIGPIPGPLQYFAANVLSYQDYYAFGMLMPDRQYVLTGDSSYRYGFNGKEQDNEVMGYGNSQDYGERFYDVRIGRFRSVDPLFAKYPELSSYQFSSDNPVKFIDIDGKEAEEDDFEEASEGGKDPRVVQAERSLKDPYEEIREREEAQKKADRAQRNAQTNKIIRRPSGERLLSKPGFSERFGGEVKIENSSTPGNPPKDYFEPDLKPRPLGSPDEEEAEDILNRKGDKHHIATNKNDISNLTGGPWTPIFRQFFENAGLDIDNGPENIVEVIDHVGPHPQEYHEIVFERLTEATEGIKPYSPEYKEAVTKALEQIGKEAQIKGTVVNSLLTLK